MRITILAYGTRGDVQPFVALALALRAGGHDVRLAAPENFERFVGGFGLPYARLAGDMEAIMRSPEGQGWLAAGNVLALLRRMTAAMDALQDAFCRDLEAACEGAETIVASVAVMPHALSLAERSGVRMITAYTFPVFPPTSTFAQILVRPRPFPLAALNRASWALVDQAFWLGARKTLGRMRRQFGLAPFERSPAALAAQLGMPTLQLYSPLLVPRPPDWGPVHHLTGPLVLPAGSRGGIGEAEPPASLAEWLAAGPPPVFFGFGSMPVLDPAGMLALVREAAAELGVRAVVGAGWSDYGEVDDARVRVVAGIDHEWLFPRCAAVVHHGGAGTTAVGLRAGVPALVCSLFADQPFWAARLTELGIGAHLPFQKLDRRRLVAALRPLLAPQVHARAQALGAQAREEPGATAAARLVAETTWTPRRV